MPHTHNLASVVLAGGHSSRMGTNKALLPYKGQPLIYWIVKSMEQLGAPVWISVQQPDYQFLNKPLLLDQVPNIGPMAALHAALHQIPAHWYALGACDAPILNPLVYNALLHHRQPNKLAVYLTAHGHHHPLIAIYSAAIRPWVNKAVTDGRYGLMRLLNQVPSQSVPLESLHEPLRSTPVFNLNTPNDYNNWLQEHS